MQVPRVLVFADDLTGAIETGAKFANCGLRARVLLWPDLDPVANDTPEVLVIDTETRHLPAEVAANRIRDLTQKLHQPGIELLYKKTDSTLRGNIAAELTAIAESLSGQAIVYAPAYPAFGRTVKNGRLYVNGIPLHDTEFASDPLNPVRSNNIRDLLGWNGRIHIHDGEVESEVEAVADKIMRQTPRPVACGPAALAGHLAERLGQKRNNCASLPKIARCLVVNGSMHPRSLEQIRYAELAGWDIIASRDASAALVEPRWGILRSLDIPPLHIDALVIFGGDTAFQIARTLGCSALDPLTEVLPGIPISQIVGAPSGPRYLITKAGGFGPPDVLGLLRARLSAGN